MRNVLFIGFFLGNFCATQAASLIAGVNDAYPNNTEYDVPTIDWLSPDQSIESRIALLDFAAAYLKFTRSLGPQFQQTVKVNISGKSAEEAISQVEKVTGVKIPRKITSPDQVKISLKGMDTGTNLLLKIIDLSGMTPSFESGSLALSPPKKKP